MAYHAVAKGPGRPSRNEAVREGDEDWKENEAYQMADSSTAATRPLDTVTSY